MRKCVSIFDDYNSNPDDESVNNKENKDKEGKTKTHNTLNYSKHFSSIHSKLFQHMHPVNKEHPVCFILCISAMNRKGNIISPIPTIIPFNAYNTNTVSTKDEQPQTDPNSPYFAKIDLSQIRNFIPQENKESEPSAQNETCQSLNIEGIEISKEKRSFILFQIYNFKGYKLHEWLEQKPHSLKNNQRVWYRYSQHKYYEDNEMLTLKHLIEVCIFRYCNRCFLVGSINLVFKPLYVDVIEKQPDNNLLRVINSLPQNTIN